MRIAIPKIYCSVADLQMTPYISFNTFRSNLLLNQLFCGDLVVPDAFLFMSPYVIKDVKLGEDKSICLEGLKCGHIKPCFREMTQGSFKDSLKAIKDQGIVGMIEGSEFVAESLEANVLNFDFYRYVHWPKHLVGRGFFEEIRNTLGPQEPYIKTKDSLEIWKKTNEWRTELVSLAQQQTKDGTLRRGELLDLVARKVGWDSLKKVPNAQTAITAARRHKKILKTYLQWINQCYQRNHAKQFKLRSSALSGTGLEQLAVFDKKESQSSDSHLTVFEHTVYIPSISLLLRMPLSQVLALRRSPEGKDYFRSWSDWRKMPTVGNTMALTKNLSNYAARLRSKYNKLLSGKTIQAVGIKVPEKRSKTEKYWLDTAWKAIGQIPLIGNIIFLVEQGWAGLKIYNPNRAELLKNVALRSKSKRLKLRLEEFINTTTVNTQIVKK